MTGALWSLVRAVRDRLSRTVVVRLICLSMDFLIQVSRWTQPSLPELGRRMRC
jgi:hypothetical protein